MMDVTPNPIDFSAVAAGFSSMFDTRNVVVFFFIAAMFLFYVLVLVWSRRADKRDTEQVLFSFCIDQKILDVELGCTSKSAYTISGANIQHHQSYSKNMS